MRQLKITTSITAREDLSLDKYLTDISKEGMIVSDEEVILAQRIKAGDPVALNKLVRANLRFVVSVAKQYQNQGMSLNDLINEGNVGLIKAAKKFDETRGFKFISYAVWWIRQSIMQAVSENSRIVRIPLNRHSTLSKMKKGSAKLEQELERLPTSDELAELLEIEVDAIEICQRISGRSMSMDAPLISGETHTLADTIPCSSLSSPDENLNSESLQSDVERLLTVIPTREAEIVRLFFGIGNNHPISLEEIGLKLELTKERVRQLKEHALRRLRKSSGTNTLKMYLAT